MRFDCLVLAGGVPTSEDPLYRYTQGQPKAMIDMGGRPMIERVVNGLQASESVGEVVIVGLDKETFGPQLNFTRPVVMLPNQHGMIPNTLLGMRWIRDHNPDAQFILGCADDVPHITGDMVDGFVEQCAPYDCVLYYSAIEPDVMEAAYPGSNRTFINFKGGVKLSGANLFLLDMNLVDQNPDLWTMATDARKHGWRIARLVGWTTLIKYQLRQLSLPEAEAAAARLIGLDKPVRVLPIPYAAVGMDGDKPNQIDMLRMKYNQP